MVGSESPQFRFGITGNYYVFCDLKEPLIDIAVKLKKSINSIYFNSRYKVWVIKVKNKTQKNILKNLSQLF